MKLLIIVFLLLYHTAYALNIEDAQRCADQLLEAYRTKEYPDHLLNVQYIVASAVGRTFSQRLDREKQLLLAVGEKILRESFESPNYQYQFQKITVQRIINNTKVIGRVVMKSPQGNGEYDFETISDKEKCYIKAVTIGSIFSLKSQVRDNLNKDSKTAHLFQINKK